MNSFSNNLIQLLIFQGTPEVLALVILAISILGAKIKPPKVIILSLIIDVTILSIRLSNFPWGVHTLIGTLVLGAGLSIISGKPSSKCILAAVLSMSILCLLEIIADHISSMLLNIPVKQIYNQGWLQFVVAWFHISIMFILACIIRRKNLFFSGA